MHVENYHGSDAPSSDSQRATRLQWDNQVLLVPFDVRLQNLSKALHRQRRLYIAQIESHQIA